MLEIIKYVNKDRKKENVFTSTNLQTRIFWRTEIKKKECNSKKKTRRNNFVFKLWCFHAKLHMLFNTLNVKFKFIWRISRLSKITVGFTFADTFSFSWTNSKPNICYLSTDTNSAKTREKKWTQHILSKKRIVTLNLPIQFWAEVRPFVG
jgi:hypothetical protein